MALYRWLAACDVRDEHGQPVHLTPHQWRHTLGTRLINRDVPQEVVRRILDHDSRADDRPLRPAARHHRPPALGKRPQGQHPRPDRHLGPRRSARRGGLGQTAARPRHPSPAQRLLRPARAAELPARQRLPDLPDVPHHPRVPAPAPPAPPADPADHHRRRGPRPATARRDEPAGRSTTSTASSPPSSPRQPSRRTPHMRADNTALTWSPPPSSATNSPAPRPSQALHELDRAGAAITFESVARARRRLPLLALHPARHPRRDPNDSAPDRRPPTAPIPSPQRASDDSLRAAPRDRATAATANSPTKTSDCAANSPRARSTPPQRMDPTRRAESAAHRNSVTISPC